MNNLSSTLFRLFPKTFLIFILSLLTVQVTFSQSDLRIDLSAGIALNYAPSFTFSGDRGSGSLFSIFGDIEINERLIGRAQYSTLITSTLQAEKADRITSGFSIMGSLGYIFSTPVLEKFEIPVMATAGYASVSTRRSNNGSSNPEPGMQAGITVSPHYNLTENLAIHSSLRYLKGIKVNHGIILDQVDLAVGIRYTFL